MQLFRLHPNPIANARDYPDVYTYNQIREASQFMQLAIHLHGGSIPDNPATQYEHHPCTVWASTSVANWLDTYAIVSACHAEWLRRYDHPPDKIHNSFKKINSVVDAAIDCLPRAGYSLQPCVFPDKFKPNPAPTTVSEVCENYRNYIVEAKAEENWFKYDKGTKPTWIP